ncbi:MULTISPECIES: N-acetylglucosamine-6-phosphate deacetylase [unclassified Paenibacillus]|uniref:N-acetylglucosamine-6-phosphate deacetylase n=1 Tax=unclassified Paenibacillus TaxID=185978 RepID=UPI0004A61E27|nr:MULTISPECIES: amidohydrolase family protein [unclassified Paenibacillus]KGP85210.1 N-acetylglucosamine-6-phosphate deacetylase [Paenibacillus sp. MAEPY2]KGP85933.1 N-acetylglucosamine-6-phosphate deacetylase [Paenibacillus sp. MAEPY1]
MPMIGKHYRTGMPIEVKVRDGRITAVTEIEISPSVDCLPWLAPGLVDLQVNGGWGLDLNTALLCPDTVLQLTRKLQRQGVTNYCPTLITNSSVRLVEAASTIAKAVRMNPDMARGIAGIHLEGPFISPEDGPRGAHPVQHIVPPDWEALSRWQEAAEGLIRIITLSPEWPGAASFISRCRESGILVSIGHTAATPEQIREAVSAGALMSTHLGNGAHLMLPRHPNYLWEQLAADELYGCMIADGHHLPLSVLAVILRMKRNRAILVSDAVSLSGMPPGSYNLHIGGDVVLTAEGRLHLAGQPELLAGSAMMLPDQVGYLVDAGLSGLPDAWDCASVHPARLLGFEQAAGLAIGAPADIVSFNMDDGKLSVLQCWKNGRISSESQ